MAKISLILAIVSISHLVFAQQEANVQKDYPEFETHVFTLPEDTLPYRLLLPQSIQESKKYPLVIFLHGGGERGSDNVINLKYITDLFLEPENRKNFPAFITVPQCPANERWAPSDWHGKLLEPMSSVVSLIDSLSATYPIDTKRIYVMGLSLGGYGTWFLLTRFPDRFAAAVPICGGGDWSQAHAFSHVPIWAFHGKKDEVVLPEQSRKMVHSLKKAGGKPLYTEYKKVGHDSWTPAFKEPGLLPWMFSKSR